MWVAPAGTPPGAAGWQLAGRIDAAQLDQLAAGFNEAGRVMVAHAERMTAAFAAALAPLGEQMAQVLAAAAGQGDAMRWQPGDWTGP